MLSLSPRRPLVWGTFFFYEAQEMNSRVKIPPAWMDEAWAAYAQYVEEWTREEAERAIITGDDPEPAQAWPDFFSEYLYAELENSVYVSAANTATANDYR